VSSADLFFKGRGFFHRSCPRAADLQNRSTLHLLFCRAERRSAKGQREIFNVIAPGVLFGDDMLNMVRQLAVLLAQQAILATMIRSSSDEVPRGGVHR